MTAVAAEERDSEACDLPSADADRDGRMCHFKQTPHSGGDEARLTQIHPTVETAAPAHPYCLAAHCSSTGLAVAAIPRDLTSSS